MRFSELKEPVGDWRTRGIELVGIAAAMSIRRHAGTPARRILFRMVTPRAERCREQSLFDEEIVTSMHFHLKSFCMLQMLWATLNIKEVNSASAHPSKIQILYKCICNRSSLASLSTQTEYYQSVLSISLQWTWRYSCLFALRA